MDEISLNIARHHCRSPLSGGENARLKKALDPQVFRFSQKRKCGVSGKRKDAVSNAWLRSGERLGSQRIVGPAFRSCPFAGCIFPVSVVWKW
ncbi:hypothetical protein J2857_002461 [Neorhizobium galegae]|uniref:hypothetical protein n=1 Tax=Neorhizobium galegae TaxID=399 RepID=UPI001AE8D650|nr:hypothetical protein [Neorhizobium galegae]MBP2559692.1 hypothetical protein [Neorhizobium galegae]